MLRGTRIKEVRSLLKGQFIIFLSVYARRINPILNKTGICAKLKTGLYLLT